MNSVIRLMTALGMALGAAGVLLLAQPSGGTGEFPRVRLTSGPCVVSAGSGSPEGVLTGNVCDLFQRTNGVAGAVLYVKASGSGNTGWETAAGTGVTANGAALPTAIVRKAADETVTTSTTLQDDDHLNATIGVSETQLFTWTLYLDAATAGDFKFALNVPAGATGIQAAFGLRVGATTTSDTITTSATTDLTDTGTVSLGGAGAGTPVVVRITATIVNSTTAGTVKLRWAQDTSDGTATKILTNSRLETVDVAGAVASRTTFANRPSALYPGRLHFPSDAYTISRDTGTVWQPWGPIFALVTPDDTGFAWVNQGGATVDVTKDVFYLQTPGEAGQGLRMRVKTAPAAPFAITALVLCTHGVKSFNTCGIDMRDSGTGRVLDCGMTGITNDAVYISTRKFTAANAFSASYQDIPLADGEWRGLIWLRFEDDNTNRKCSYSNDGQHWVQVHSVSRTDFATANQVGYHAGAENGSAPNIEVGITILSWSVQ